MDVQTQLTKIVRDLGVDPALPTPIYRQLNSLALVEFIIKLETTFQIEISIVEYDPKQFESIDAITLMIKNKTNS